MTRRQSDVFVPLPLFPIEKTHDPRTEKINRTQLLAEHATLSFLVSSIYNQLYHKLLKLQHSLGDGYYLTDSNNEKITEEMINEMTLTLKNILDSDTEIILGHTSRKDLIETFEKNGLEDKISLMKTWSDEMIPVVTCGSYIDYTLEPMSTDKERLKINELRPYNNGIILRFPTLLQPASIHEWSDPKALFEMFREHHEWAHLIGCDTVGKLNEMIYKRQIDDIKWVSEGLHEQKLAKIAKYLVKRYASKRVVTIAGPSSSNKTTFAKRLSIQLRVNGYRAVIIEMDDFYRNTTEIPYGPDGLQDFESISALNIDILSQRVADLLEGKSVPRRKFDFQKGVGIDSDTNFYDLPDKTFLIIEGIHGLNPELLSSIGRDKVTPIYVSALTPLNLDYNHRFPTSDLRLIRRIIRDYRYRGYSPRKTIRRWTSVRIGEERNIFPYQHNAELFFNSALVYELPVLSVNGKALLAEATIPEPDEDPNSPESMEITREARRILGLLNFFYPVSTEIVPHISCIREFIGGSDLKY